MLTRGVLRASRIRRTGVGPQTRLYGTDAAGYYGRVSEADSISYANLMTWLKVYFGKINTSGAGWLKYSFNGRVLLISRQPVSVVVAKEDLYSEGLVYGADEYGLTQSGTPTKQLRIVRIGDYQYKVRLMNGFPKNPINPSYEFNRSLSEWDALLVRSAAAYGTGAWDSLTLAELGLSGDGARSIMKETYSALHGYSLLRPGGVLTTDFDTISGWVAVAPGYFNKVSGWRVVLELLPPQPVSPIITVVSSGLYLTQAQAYGYATSRELVTAQVYSYVPGQPIFPAEATNVYHI